MDMDTRTSLRLPDDLLRRVKRVANAMTKAGRGLSYSAVDIIHAALVRAAWTPSRARSSTSADRKPTPRPSVLSGDGDDRPRIGCDCTTAPKTDGSDTAAGHGGTVRARPFDRDGAAAAALNELDPFAAVLAGAGVGAA